MSPWLSVVGIGDDGLDGLSPAARAAIEQAEVLVGGKRHLSMLASDEREQLVWPSPFDGSFSQLDSYAGRAVCVLASGDPNCYGVGTKLVEKLGLDAVQIIPAPSAYSLACARLGWNLAEVDTLTLHGRPLELMHAYVLPGARLLILSADGGTPARIAALLCARGYGSSAVTVLEHMGGTHERLRSHTAQSWPDLNIANLNTVAVQCTPSADALLLSRTPGLPDDAYRHDGQLTKREVRSMTLAALSPVAGQLLWDVGAGCGSVAIEWMRATGGGRAIALESNPARIKMITENAASLGAPTLEIVHGKAPAALAGLPRPDAIFIGGGVTGEGLLDACWSALKPGGRLVANAVSVEGEQSLAAWQQRHGGSLTRIAISRAESIGRFKGWRPLMPVLQYAAGKHQEDRS
jgi:precorrin-6Y C5,15-methyltransferase (decarboxylating)